MRRTTLAVFAGILGVSPLCAAGGPNDGYGKNKRRTRPIAKRADLLKNLATARKRQENDGQSRDTRR